jgi:hypothetical protein
MTFPNVGSEAIAPACAIPDKRAGRSVDLLPLDERQAKDLWQASLGADESWTYLGYGPFLGLEHLKRHVAKLVVLTDQPFFAVVPKNEPAMGWLSYCDIELHNAAIEIGSIWFAPPLTHTGRNGSRLPAARSCFRKGLQPDRVALQRTELAVKTGRRAVWIRL